jgi:signal transduction histidine kinase
MHRRRATQLVTMYVLSLAATIALLVVWVVYIVRSYIHAQALRTRIGEPAEGFSWIILSVGCLLLFFLIVGLSYQLAQALAARRHAQQQEEFLSNVTHDMKTPIAAIKLHAQTLQGGDMPAAAQARSVDFIVREVDRLGTLVDNVLESSRLLATERTLHLHPVEVAPFFASYFVQARPHAEARGIALTTEVATNAVVLATEEALRRVLDNLIGNAVRFSQKGGEVRCRVTELGRTLRIEVEDDGVGIPKKELARIFERFYQPAGEAGAHRHGTGLGLSIVSGLVREMSGTVEAFSQDARPGSRFVVDLPIQETR